MNNFISEPKYVKLGVPQGNALGPVMYLIYINALLNFPSIKNKNSKANLKNKNRRTITVDQRCFVLLGLPVLINYSKTIPDQF